MIAVRTEAPDFTLEDQFGCDFHLRQHRGRRSVEALADRFLDEANTLVHGISVDSRHSHANWGWDLGGISGISDRATVIVDHEGMVRYAESVGPKGQRDLDVLLKRATALRSARPLPVAAPRELLAKDATLYVRKGCPFCRAVLRALSNLHCVSKVRVRDVVEDAQARLALDRLAGPDSKVPVLVQDGRVLPDSAAIIGALAVLHARA